MVRDPRLEHLCPRQRRLCGVGHDVDMRLKLDIFSKYANPILFLLTFSMAGQSRFLGVGLEDIAPDVVWSFGYGHVQEDGIGA